MGECVAIIPARGGSKGIPNKNIIHVAGKPLLVWSIEHALQSTQIHSVWVTSDSTEILEIARKHGAQPILRPDDISGDEATSEDAWIHALSQIRNSIDVDLVVCLQPTSPVRGPNDLDEAIEKYYMENFDSLLSVTQIEDHFEWRMSEVGAKPINYDYHNRKRRQDIEVKFLENGSFYIVSPDILVENKNRLGGRIGFYEQEKYKMYQIDNPSDVTLCEAILYGYKLDG